MSIGNFIEASLHHYNHKQYDIALALASSAIDATATKCGYIGNNNTKYKDYLRHNMKTIITFGFPGISASGIKIKCHNIKGLKTDKEGMIDIENIIYHTIRCGLIHQCDISQEIEFTEQTIIGDFNQKFKVPKNLVLGLIVSVVQSKCNQDEYLTQTYNITNPFSQEKFILQFGK